MPINVLKQDMVNLLLENIYNGHRIITYLDKTQESRRVPATSPEA